MTGSECSGDCLRTVVQATDRSSTRRLKPNSGGWLTGRAEGVEDIQGVSDVGLAWLEPRDQRIPKPYVIAVAVVAESSCLGRSLAASSCRQSPNESCRFRVIPGE